MNIAICSPYAMYLGYERNGSYIVVLDAISRLADRGHRVTLYTNTCKDGKIDHPNIRYREVDRNSNTK